MTQEDMHYLRSILFHLREFQDIARRMAWLNLGTEVLNDNIDWLDCFIEKHQRENWGGGMKIKCLEIRDRNTFIPVMCFRPIPENDKQRYLLRRDGWSCRDDEHSVMLIDTHRNRAMHNPYDYGSSARTLPEAHRYIEKNFDELQDGDVVDVEYILGETTLKKRSERYDAT